jgi:hypothetical protein
MLVSVWTAAQLGVRAARALNQRGPFGRVVPFNRRREDRLEAFGIGRHVSLPSRVVRSPSLA